MRKPLAGATIVFDLDGTLVDTAPDLVRATNEVMDHAGLPHVPLHDVRGMVGQGARALIVKAAQRAGVHFSDADLAGHIQHFLATYRAGIVDLSRPFDGVEVALERLAPTSPRRWPVPSWRRSTCTIALPLWWGASRRPPTSPTRVIFCIPSPRHTAIPRVP
jgi:beta-phosphoglucomutase-like phosphatase (HAD superfamily)